MKAEQGKDPEKAKAGKEKFVKILKGCGFQGLVALAGEVLFFFYHKDILTIYSLWVLTESFFQLNLLFPVKGSLHVL